MLSRLVAMAVVALLARDAAAESKARERAVRVGVIAGVIALYIVNETVAKDALSPDRCRWCGSNDLDEGFREAAVWGDRDQARNLSNIIGYGASPIAGAALLFAASAGTDLGRWELYAEDITAMFEVVWGTQIVTQLTKIIAGRRRPYAHPRAGEPAPPISTQEDNLSFFSGHSSLTFSIAVGAGVIAERRGYKLAPVIWASGLALAATTAYLRMAADRHYFTDVMVGSAVGALGGLMIPRITGSMPASVVPQPGGVALVGQF